MQELRAAMRDALGRDPAPADVHRRVRAEMPAEPQPWLARLIGNWIVPAAATAIVAWIVVPWQPGEPDGDALRAIGEHVACALEHAAPIRDVSAYAPTASMPLVTGGGDHIRIVDAHVCGGQTDFVHLVVEDGESTASILLARAAEGAARTIRPHTRGAFEVSGIRTTRHRAYVVIDGARSPQLRQWRGPALRRVERFLKAVEGT
jgi:hypothetical protein